MALLKLPATLVATILLVTGTGAAETGYTARRSPEYQNGFEFPLPIPQIKKPSATYVHPESGTPIDFYELEALAFERKLFPDLGSAKLFGFDGAFPGPTFRVEKGRETVVRVVNKGQRKMNLHLHGSYSMFMIRIGSKSTDRF
jgi:bilirubin oxidase